MRSNRISNYSMIFIVLAVYLAANFYVIYRLWQLMPPTVIGRIILVAAGVVLSLAMFASMAFGSKMPSGLTAFLYKAGTSWFFILLYLLFIFLVCDLLRVTHILPMEKVMYGNWKSLVVLIVFMTALFSAGYAIYRNKKRVELTITLDKDIPKPIKIVMASDLHLGYGIGKKELGEWVGLINRENPDIVLFAGDVVDNSVKPLWKQGMADSLKRIKSRYGVFAAPGNHEYIAGLDDCIVFLTSSDIDVLVDCATLVGDSFYIIGRDAMPNRNRKPLAEIMEGIDTSKPIIVLDHQPSDLEDAAANKADVLLCGHTHHGQVWPINWITDAMFEKAHGYLKKDDTNIYVSSGLGLWGGKYRLGSRSEYVVINIIGKK